MRAFLWPKTIKSETTVVVRLGRVLHWFCAIVAGIVVTSTVVINSMAVYERAEMPSEVTVAEVWGPVLGAVAFALAFLLFGRALRYVFSGE
jgi:nicotinamide riboside transporter PnuC